MSTLLLRLAARMGTPTGEGKLTAPMQSWGDESKFTTRRTLREPTKSGVVGLLGAAMGIRREQDEEIARLNRALRMGVRVDQEGEVRTDFHMVKDFKRANNKGEIRYEKDGAPMPNNGYVTYRDYLHDAVFLVGLESEDTALLQSLAAALMRPAFALYLGRRSCPPTLPLLLGVRECALEDALRAEPWQAAKHLKRRGMPKAGLRLLIEEKPGTVAQARQRDVPLSFNPQHRRHGFRALQQEQRVLLEANEHDAMAEL